MSHPSKPMLTNPLGYTLLASPSKRQQRSRDGAAARLRDLGAFGGGAQHDDERGRTIDLSPGQD